MKLFSLPARTDRLTTTGPGCADELTMEVPASPTAATFPDDSAMSSSSRIIASASRRSSSETASISSDSLEGDSTTNSRRVCVATSRDDSDASGPQATDTNVEMQVFQRIAPHAGLKITRSIVPTSTPHSRWATDETYTTNTNATAETAENAITHES